MEKTRATVPTIVREAGSNLRITVSKKNQRRNLLSVCYNYPDAMMCVTNIVY